MAGGPYLVFLVDLPILVHVAIPLCVCACPSSPLYEDVGHVGRTGFGALLLQRELILSKCIHYESVSSLAHILRCWARDLSTRIWGRDSPHSKGRQLWKEMGAGIVNGAGWDPGNEWGLPEGKSGVEMRILRSPAPGTG